MALGEWNTCHFIGFIIIFYSNTETKFCSDTLEQFSVSWSLVDSLLSDSSLPSGSWGSLRGFSVSCGLKSKNSADSGRVFLFYSRAMSPKSPGIWFSAILYISIFCIKIFNKNLRIYALKWCMCDTFPAAITRNIDSGNCINKFWNTQYTFLVFLVAIHVLAIFFMFS